MELCLQDVTYQLGPVGRHHPSHFSMEGVEVQWDNNPKQCGSYQVQWDNNLQHCFLSVKVRDKVAWGCEKGKRSVPRRPQQKR